MGVSLELVAYRARIATIAGCERGARAGIRLLGGGPARILRRRSAPAPPIWVNVMLTMAMPSGEE
ncbi:hypothetical protein [Streptomyces sp. NPDC006739]|uniref:hypothetical protein n=1 Tax=Streptomyces sp. NPDC006739 TaxID=3364763 RepID=UPI003682D131